MPTSQDERFGVFQLYVCGIAMGDGTTTAVYPHYMDLRRLCALAERPGPHQREPLHLGDGLSGGLPQSKAIVSGEERTPIDNAHRRTVPHQRRQPVHSARIQIRLALSNPTDQRRESAVDLGL
jgi:hypothetical protein